MALASYLDECVDLELASALRNRGFVTQTAAEAGMLGAVDEQQLAYATHHNLVLITHNARDFRRLHRRLAEEGAAHAAIVALPQTGNLLQLDLRAAMMLDWLTEGD